MESEVSERNDAVCKETKRSEARYGIGSRLTMIWCKLMEQKQSKGNDVVTRQAESGENSENGWRTGKWLRRKRGAVRASIEETQAASRTLVSCQVYLLLQIPVWTAKVGRLLLLLLAFWSQDDFKICACKKPIGMRAGLRTSIRSEKEALALISCTLVFYEYCNNKEKTI